MQGIHLEVIGPVGECAVVKVGGEVDVYTAPKLREQIVALAGDGVVHLVADLSDVEFLDSTGLGVLVGGLKRLRTAGGSLGLVMTTERITRIFRITGLTAVFPCHASIAEAVDAEPHWAAAAEREAGGIDEWRRAHGVA